MEIIEVIIIILIVIALLWLSVDMATKITDNINETCKRLNWSGGDWKRKNGKMVFYCFDALEEVLFELDKTISKEIKKEKEETQCSNLTEEDVIGILRMNFEDTFHLLLATDGAIGEPTFVPMLKYYCK